jgi:hypothetical protein
MSQTIILSISLFMFAITIVYAGYRACKYLRERIFSDVVRSIIGAMA